MMLSERRPILLANARIIDPSRDIDIIGDLLIADGMIREAKRGIGAAGVPEGTEVIDCRGKVIAPGLIDMRAFIGEPGAGHRETFASASQAAAAGGAPLGHESLRGAARGARRPRDGDRPCIRRAPPADVGSVGTFHRRGP